MERGIFDGICDGTSGISAKIGKEKNEGGTTSL
jgi:hypothetical protein